MGFKAAYRALEGPDTPSSSATGPASSSTGTAPSLTGYDNETITLQPRMF
ncbi:hypothetical protein [Actinomadura nitritigenes]